MSKRKLKRQLNLLQVVMLGTAGTIAAEIFVLTGHAAGMAGPATVLVVLAAGILSFSIALNYCELATAFPVTGGALTYVREAYGTNLLSFLVGSFDCLSSTFYSALSAVGFAYSVQVFVPALPIVPTAVVVVCLFVVLNLLGVTKVGNLQIVLGGMLLLVLGVYVVGGLLLPGGFRWELFSEGGIFIHRGWANVTMLFATMALIYNAYVGFEVIADDAEEVKEPDRNLPRGILISLTLVTLIYVLVAFVTLGTVPWQRLAGSETALTDAVRSFLPAWGLPMMAVAGIIATLTSVNTAMLSATREALTLSRDGLWPRALSRLSRFRTPHIAVLFIGLVVALVAAVGVVDFLSYISSSGYLFVLFWSNLAMVRLRRKYPDVKRPFAVPLFPLTPYLAAGTCVLAIAFTNWRALLFGAGVLLACTAFYYLYRPISRVVAARVRALELAKDRILIPVANPRTAASLVHLATILAQASEDTSICVLTIVPVSPHLAKGLADRLVARLAARQKAVLSQITAEAQSRNVPLYTKLRPASSISEGILEELNGAVKLILLGWPGPVTEQMLPETPVKHVLQRAHAHVAVLLDRGLQGIRRVLVPVGGGPHSRLAIRIAYEIAEREDAELTALHCFCEQCDADELEDRMLILRETIEDELGSVPPRIATRLAFGGSVIEGILSEAARQPYDLMVVGSSEEWADPAQLFGSIDDYVADRVGCSVLLVRRYEPVAIAWLRRRTKRPPATNNHNGG